MRQNFIEENNINSLLIKMDWVPTDLTGYTYIR